MNKDKNIKNKKWGRVFNVLIFFKRGYYKVIICLKI